MGPSFYQDEVGERSLAGKHFKNIEKIKIRLDVKYKFFLKTLKFLKTFFQFLRSA